MASKGEQTVSMRVRIGDVELEASGPRGFVEEKISDFMKEQRQLSARPGGVKGVIPSADAAPGKAPGGKPTSEAQFFKKASPKSDVERTLVAGYFLEKFAGVESFATADIVQTIRKSKNKPPVNASDAVAKNIKKGLMMSAGDKEGKRTFVLTTDGEEAVALALDQAQ